MKNVSLSRAEDLCAEGMNIFQCDFESTDHFAVISGEVFCVSCVSQFTSSVIVILICLLFLQRPFVVAFS